MVRAANLISDWLDRFCRIAAGGFLTVMLLLILFQVVARYIFQSVPVWTEEMARWCMVWGGLLGATLAFRIDADPRLFQPPLKGSRIWVCSAFWLRTGMVIVFLGPVLWYSDRFIARMMARTAETMEIPLGWVSLAIPVMVLVIFIHLAARIVTSRGGLEPPRPDAFGGSGTRN
jgi:TRAP-type C4-dicarboxylate transport system permease small subunit